MTRIAEIAILAAQSAHDAHEAEGIFPTAHEAHAFLSNWDADDMPDDQWEDDLLSIGCDSERWIRFEQVYYQVIERLGKRG